MKQYTFIYTIDSMLLTYLAPLKTVALLELKVFCDTW